MPNALAIQPVDVSNYARGAQDANLLQTQQFEQGARRNALDQQNKTFQNMQTTFQQGQQDRTAKQQQEMKDDLADTLIKLKLTPESERAAAYSSEVQRLKATYPQLPQLSQITDQYDPVQFQGFVQKAGLGRFSDAQLDQYMAKKQLGQEVPKPVNYGQPVAGVDASGNPVFNRFPESGAGPQMPVQGFTPTPPKANDTNAPSGYRFKRDGSLEPIPGGPASYGGGAAAVGTVTGDEFLKTIPSNIGPQVKALAEGRMAFPSGFALKSPYWQNMLQAVAQYDPNFDAVNYNARAQTRAAFTKGPPATSLAAMNTVMGHFENFDNAAKNLNNSGFTSWNTAINYLGGKVNPELKARLNRFNTDKQALATELTRAYRGTGGAEADIKEWEKNLDSADSYEALHATTQEGLSLLKSRIDALGDQYNKGMGTTKDGLTLLSPKAQEAFVRLSGEAQTPQAAPAVNAIQEGATATNPQTGQKIIYRGGQWVPTQ